MELPQLPNNPDFKDQMLYIIVNLLKKLLKSNDALSQQPEIEPPALTEKIIERVEVPVEKIIEKPNSFTLALQPYRQMQAAFVNDNEIMQIVIGNYSQADNPETLVRLIANFAQWERVVDIWETLAQRCKQENRAANNQEQYLLQTAVQIYNLIWRDKTAKLENIDIGMEYDYKKMQRGNIVGNQVVSVWLPALYNAGGQVEKTVLVETQ